MVERTFEGTQAYSIEDFNKDIRLLLLLLQRYQYRVNKPFDFIVGLSRGGSIPATCLSHSLKIPCTMIDYATHDGIDRGSICDSFDDIAKRFECERILIVDDIVDSGTAMRNVVKAAQGYFKDPCVATLLHNVDVDLGVDHFWATSFSRQTTKSYFDFWWETID